MPIVCRRKIDRKDERQKRRVSGVSRIAPSVSTRLSDSLRTCFATERNQVRVRPKVDAFVSDGRCRMCRTFELAATQQLKFPTSGQDDDLSVFGRTNQPVTYKNR